MLALLGLIALAVEAFRYSIVITEQGGESHLLR